MTAETSTFEMLNSPDVLLIEEQERLLCKLNVVLSKLLRDKALPGTQRCVQGQVPPTRPLRRFVSSLLR